MRTVESGLALSAACAALVFTPAPAVAQAEAEPEFDRPEAIEKLYDCRTIEQPEARLACFDREVGAVFEAQQSRELVIAEREEVDEAKKGLFGLKLPNIRLFGGGDDDDGIDEISATLAGATKLGNGRHIFELEDGARWIETEDARGYRRFKAGDTIVIEKAALGSFKASVDGKRAVKVRRIN